ncbi:MAG: Gfo/Idh/MocA family oxidoreductase [Acidobacteriota bacterium]
MNKIRLALLGCGRWGKNLLRVFSQLPYSTVSTVYTRTGQDNVLALAAQYGARWCADPQESWQNTEIDAVVIATPDPTHYTFAKTALENGKHVFVEKPLAITAWQCRELGELAHNRDLTLQVGHIMQYHTATQVVAEAVAKSRWGALCHIEMNNTDLKDYPVESELLTGTLVHDLSLLACLFDFSPRIESVHAFSLGVGAPIAAVRAELYYGSVPVSLRCSMAYPVANRDMILTFERALLRFDRTGKGRLTAHTAVAPPMGMHYQTTYSTNAELPFPEQEPLRLECEDFLAAIKQHRAPVANATVALRIAETLDALRQRILV